MPLSSLSSAVPASPIAVIPPAGPAGLPGPADRLPPESPSRWLQAGYVRHEDAGRWAWVRRRAVEPVSPGEQPLTSAQLDALFSQAWAPAYFNCLAEKFAPYLPLNAAQWEADIRQAPWPRTSLRLWDTVLGRYFYYVVGKRHRPGAAADFFYLILDFSNLGAEYARRPRHLRALKPARVQRVVAELERWFAKSGPL